ncbi:microtubule-associated protein RP/EB family member 1A, partial [Tanacetum coccineum]
KPKTIAVESDSSEEIQALSNEITELKVSVDLLEKERDYYFAKLRDIEILCQGPELEHIPMVVAVKKVLYASDEESALAEAQEIVSASQ